MSRDGPMVQWMKSEGIELTLDNWLELEFGGVPNPIPPAAYEIVPEMFAKELEERMKTQTSPASQSAMHDLNNLPFDPADCRRKQDPLH